jgi:hypothetical protein
MTYSCTYRYVSLILSQQAQTPLRYLEVAMTACGAIGFVVSPFLSGYVVVAAASYFAEKTTFSLFFDACMHNFEHFLKIRHTQADESSWQERTTKVDALCYSSTGSTTCYSWRGTIWWHNS